MRGGPVRPRVSLFLAVLVGIAAGATPVAVVLLTVRTPPPPPTPVVTLGNATGDIGVFVVDVATSEPRRPLREFGATLLRNGLEMEVIARLSGPAFGQFRFEDRADIGVLSPGDRFTSRWTDAGHYEIRLFWRDQVLATAPWDIAVPAITFAPASIGEDRITVNVSSANPRNPLFDFRASLWYDSTLIAMIEPLDAPSRWPFLFEDRDGDLRLSAGDRFTTSWVYPYPYELRIEWRGSFVANARWTVYAPNVTLTFDRVGPTTFWFNVTDAQPLWRLWNYGASVVRDGNGVDRMDNLFDGTGTNGFLSYEDRDMDGMLSAGDRLVVETNPYGTWELFLFWHQYEIGHLVWTV